MNQSIKTINSPEFINLQPLDINPLMSACEIKVLYIGENRNHTFISKETATEMAKTLRGAPIVGYWKEKDGDFGDHGHRMIIDDEGIKCECLTVPYGFVAPDAKVWFQEFEDANDFGEITVREYLMTTGYLWTGQFEECRTAVEGEGKPHSMELDEGSLNGHWSTNKQGMDFFIINDATISKLCILGEDVEPCFEGSKVSAPDVSASFAKVDDAFKQTLFSMMRDLQSALEGGQQMDDTTTVIETPVVEEPVTEPVVEEPAAPVVEEPATEPVIEEPAQEPVIEDQSEPVASDPEPAPVVEEPIAQEPDQYAQLEAEHAALTESYSALQTQHTDLQSQFDELTARYTALSEQVAELTAYRARIEEAEKDAMIEKFYMLSDEDKQDVVANKAQYTVEDIKAKLAVICFEKNISFEGNKADENNQPPVTFNLTGTNNAQPAWVTAVMQTQNGRN